MHGGRVDQDIRLCLLYLYYLSTYRDNNTEICVSCVTDRRIPTVTLIEQLGALQRQETEMVSLEMSFCHQECSDKKRKLVLKTLSPVVTAPTSLLSAVPHSGIMILQGGTGI